MAAETSVPEACAASDGNLCATRALGTGLPFAPSSGILAVLSFDVCHAISSGSDNGLLGSAVRLTLLLAWRTVEGEHS